MRRSRRDMHEANALQGTGPVANQAFRVSTALNSHRHTWLPQDAAKLPRAVRPEPCYCLPGNSCYQHAVPMHNG